MCEDFSSVRNDGLPGDRKTETGASETLARTSSRQSHERFEDRLFAPQRHPRTIRDLNHSCRRIARDKVRNLDASLLLSEADSVTKDVVECSSQQIGIAENLKGFPSHDDYGLAELLCFECSVPAGLINDRGDVKLDAISTDLIPALEMRQQQQLLDKAVEPIRFLVDTIKLRLHTGRSLSPCQSQRDIQSREWGTNFMGRMSEKALVARDEVFNPNSHLIEYPTQIANLIPSFRGWWHYPGFEVATPKAFSHVSQTGDRPDKVCGYDQREETWQNHKPFGASSDSRSKYRDDALEASQEIHRSSPNLWSARCFAPVNACQIQFSVMNRFAAGLLILTAGSFSCYAAPNDAVPYVNPLIGTQRSAVGYGGTMPFVTTPFGMTDWTPQTRQNKISVTSYNFDDTTISGFVGTHQPAIWMGDYGYVTVIPQLGSLHTTPESRKLVYSHESETARPDYYRVSLDAGADGKIQTEMTATERCSIFRFIFSKSAQARVIIETSRPGIAGMASVNPEAQEITGYNPHRMDAHLGPLALPNFKGYFVVQFQQAPEDMKTYGMSDAKAESSRGAYAEFKPGQTVQVRVGTSFISIDQARQNLQHEIPGWDFQAVREQLRAQWNEKLSRLQVGGATDEGKTQLYTAMYHTLLYPRIFSEYGHYYSAFDDTIHVGESYTAYSIWDTFRAENSMLTLLAPERIDGMITALLQNFKEGGWMPKWLQILATPTS